jgi:hypothetical protein
MKQKPTDYRNRIKALEYVNAGALERRRAECIDPSLIPEGDRYKEQYGVIIICADEPEQQKVYEALAADGYMCRVVVT